MKSTKEKSSKLKHFSTFCLIGFITITTLFATACSPTQTNMSTSHQATSSHTGLGLDPKNDPVVFTTEFGLEIRMSNADKFAGTITTTTNLGTNHTQDLSSFYYFTMGTFSGTMHTAKTLADTFTVTNEPVNWIILGVGSHSNAFVESVSNYLFSTIKNNDYLFSNGEYYFGNQHETFSPAGQLIDNVVSGKTYIMGKVKDSIKVHTEIPKGCMLVISEKLLGESTFNSTGTQSVSLVTNNSLSNLTYSNNLKGTRYRFVGDVDLTSYTTSVNKQTWTTSSGGTLYNYINSLFSKNNSTGKIIDGCNKLGFTQAQADLVVPQQLYTYYSNGSGYNHQETPSTDGGTYYTMFPLAYKAAYPSIHQNFCVEDYFLNASQRISMFIGSPSNQSFFWYLRSAATQNMISSTWVGPSGTYGATYNRDCFGVRPAMVMKLQ